MWVAGGCSACPERANVPVSVVAEVVRSGFVEGRHIGSAVAVRADGSVALSVGDPDRPIFPRSANKPLQAAAMVRCGLEVDDELLAVAAASHSGEVRHVNAVRRLLASAQLDARALANTAGLPLSSAAAAAHVRAGGGKDRVLQNCSGKHAAMLATCVINGWSLERYRDPAHPLQRRIRHTVEDLADEPVAATGVDGCGAPLFALSLVGLTRAFARLVTAAPGSAERRVADAMRAHPDVVGGTGRDVTALMRGLPGLLAKDGAEAVYAAATADGAAAAVKVEDGGDRARTPLLVTALRALGVDAPVLADYATSPVLGGGAVVGEVRIVLTAGEP